PAAKTKRTFIESQLIYKRRDIGADICGAYQDHYRRTPAFPECERVSRIVSDKSDCLITFSQSFRSNSGSLAILAAIRRRASSLVRTWRPLAWPGSSSK